MLVNLRVKNAALIRDIDMEFSEGLNILSGETGSGKSILVDSISFVLGEKVSKDFIRNGEETASVEALFSVDEGFPDCSEAGVEPDDGQLLLFRSVNLSGKSVCRINGRVVTLGMLKEVSDYLADLHGQHEHQSLLNPSKHIELLDSFCSTEAADILPWLFAVYAEYKAVLKAIKALPSSGADSEAIIELLNSQIEDIKSAGLRKNEEDDLIARKKILNNSEKLAVNAKNALELLYGLGGDELAASDQISQALSCIAKIADIDQSKALLHEQLSSVYAGLDDSVAELRDYYAELEHDPSEIEKIEGRLNQIYLLKRKYGNSVEEIFAFLEKAENRLSSIQNSEHDFIRLSGEKQALEKSLGELSEQLSQIRQQAAERICSQIIDVLKDLGMKNIQFDVSFTRKEEFSAAGFDRVEFLISPNAGEPLKPLAKIASGGEMSRIMLALKTVLAGIDNIGTFIFDEIDTGVSGRTAQQVAEKLNYISKKHQILCITHLPQIASMADRHFLLEKRSLENHTETLASVLSLDGEILELARLIGGAVITEKTIEAAREVKEMAQNIKSSI